MKKIILLMSCSLVTCYISHAQHGRVHSAMEKKYGEPGMQKGEDWMNNMMNAKTDPSYDFPVFMNMHVTNYKKSGKGEEMDIGYYLNAAKGNFATTGMADSKKGKETFMTYDMNNNSMLMLNTAEKTGMAININAFMSGEQIKQREQGTGSSSGKADPNLSCRKTGKTKTIQGYTCEQYVCKDEDRNTRSEIWITNKIAINIAQSGAKGPMAMYFANMQGIGGMMMEGDFYKNEKLETKMEVTDLNQKANMNVNIGEYKMGMR